MKLQVWTFLWLCVFMFWILHVYLCAHCRWGTCVTQGSRGKCALKLRMWSTHQHPSLPGMVRTFYLLKGKFQKFLQSASISTSPVLLLFIDHFQLIACSMDLDRLVRINSDRSKEQQPVPQIKEKLAAVCLKLLTSTQICLSRLSSY